MHVAPAFPRRQIFNPFARLVEVATLLDDLRTEHANRRNLVGIGAHRHDDAAADAMKLAGQSQRLPVVSGARRDHASLAFLVAELTHQVETAANLEGTGRVVVLVLDQHAAPDPFIEQRVV